MGSGHKPAWSPVGRWGGAPIPYVRPDMPGWKWELENLLPFMHGPFIAHTQLLSDPPDHVPAVSVGR